MSSSAAAAAAAGPVLQGAEGNLVRVRIQVEPRLLEELLDALARVSFPINPEIAHVAKPSPASRVDFPAYEGRLEEIRRALAAYHFDERLMSVTGLFPEARIPPATPLANRV